jgi:hypothetical protein
MGSVATFQPTNGGQVGPNSAIFTTSPVVSGGITFVPVVNPQTGQVSYQPVGVTANNIPKVEQPSGISRIWYLIFYVIYLALLLTAIYFMISLSDVPDWVFYLFLASCVIWVMIAIGRETLLTTQVTTEGSVVISPLSSFWRVMYWILAAIATALTIAGFIITILYSTVPWWVWTLLLVGWLLSFLASSIGMVSSSQVAWVFSIFIAILAAITYITAIILIVLYSGMPWWVWLLFGMSFLFSLIASALEPFSKKLTVVSSVQVAVPGPVVCQPPAQPLAPPTVNLPQMAVEQNYPTGTGIPPKGYCALSGVPATTTLMRKEPVIVPSKPVVISPPKSAVVPSPDVGSQSALPAGREIMVKEQIGSDGRIKAVPVTGSIVSPLPHLSELICGLPGSDLPGHTLQN